MRITTFEMTPWATNCYVLEDGGEALVVDPGEDGDGLIRLVRGLEVRMVVNTHGHCDHCGGNQAVVAETGAELACHPEDLDLVRHLPEQGAMFGLPVPLSPEPDRLLREGDTIRFGGEEVRVLHVPGHSPGHIALAGAGYVVAGDALFAGSIGRTDLPGGDMAQLLDSITTKLLTLPGDTVVYPGHGPATTIEEEQRTNPFLRQT